MNIYLSTIKSNVSERNKSVCAARFMIFNHGLPSFNEDKFFVVQQKKNICSKTLNAWSAVMVQMPLKQEMNKTSLLEIVKAQ